MLGLFVLAGANVGSDIEVEAVVAIGPIARLVPIDIHTSTAHRPSVDRKSVV